MERIVNIGDKYGRLTVVGVGKRRYYYKVQCDCGSPVKEVNKYNLVTGQTKSCGCLSSEASRKKVIMMYAARRKHFGCMVCGNDKHYAKGLCKNCYEKMKRGTLYKNYEKKYDVKGVM